MKNVYQLIYTCLFVILSLIGCGQPNNTQQEIDELRQNQKKIQGELEDIKEILKPYFDRQAAMKGLDFPVEINIDKAPFLGNKDAKVTIVEFTDYLCPFCKRHANNVFLKIKTDYIDTGKVKYVLLDYPIKKLHPNAFKLAQAARCAGEQNKYWEMHDHFFRENNKPDPENLTETIEALSLDNKSFQACLESDKSTEWIERDIAQAIKLKVQGTPNFFFGETDPNDENTLQAYSRLVGSKPFIQFKLQIDKTFEKIDAGK